MSRPVVNVTFDYDEDTRSWVYSCSDPTIVGGASSLEEAQVLAGEALGLAMGTAPCQLGEEKQQSVRLAYEVVGALG